MKILSWNVRGCNAPDKACLVKKVVDQAKLEIVMLQKTMIKQEDKIKFQQKWRIW